MEAPVKRPIPRFCDIQELHLDPTAPLAPTVATAKDAMAEDDGTEEESDGDNSDVNDLDEHVDLAPLSTSVPESYIDGGDVIDFTALFFHDILYSESARSGGGAVKSVSEDNDAPQYKASEDAWADW